jgi:hypothetical protein
MLRAMPLEGHYERQTTPLYKLSGREVKAAGIALVVTVAAMLAVVLATVGDSAPPVPQGCMTATVAGIVGAETINPCGREAVATCRHASGFEGPRAETVLASCAKYGIEF